jgi:hypothetical protein
MKSKILFSCALLAFFLGLALLIAGWQGNSSVTASWPISASVVQLSGSAKGWRPMAGLAGLIAAVILFLWGLIALASSAFRRRPEEPLAEPQPAAEASGKAASQ